MTTQIEKLTKENFTRIDNDTNGNPRYAIHFLNCLSDSEAENLDVFKKYDYAINKMHALGGKKYHNKSFGSGIAFQSYNIEDLATSIDASKLTLSERIEQAGEINDYAKQAQIFMQETGTKISCGWKEYGPYFGEKDHERHIFNISLKRGRKVFNFTFGQSVAEDTKEPKPYDIFTCFTKYDPGTFEDFCSEFGYDEDSRTAERTYKAVCKEFKELSRLYTSQELEAMALIQ